MLAIGILISIVLLISALIGNSSHYNDVYQTYLQHTDNKYHNAYTCWDCSFIRTTSMAEFVIVETFTYDIWGCLIPVAFFALVGFLLYLCCGELTITNKRIYSKASLGRKVSLPVDSVSAVATHIFNGISVLTASGRITFYFLKNTDKIYDTVNNLLINRQQKVTHTATVVDSLGNPKKQPQKDNTSLDSNAAKKQSLTQHKEAPSHSNSNTQAQPAPPSNSIVKPTNSNNTWVCKDCGTQNNINYGQCKKCGKFRS